MCQKRAIDEYYRPLEELDAELGPVMRELVLGGSYTSDGVNVGSAWVGGFAYYSLLAGL